MSARWVIVQGEEGQVFAVHRHTTYIQPDPDSRTIAAEVLTNDDGRRYALCPVCGASRTFEELDPPLDYRHGRRRS